MKKSFEEAKLELIRFSGADILTLSGEAGVEQTYGGPGSGL